MMCGSDPLRTATRDLASGGDLYQADTAQSVHASHGAQSKIQPPVFPSTMHDQQTRFFGQKLDPAP